NQASGDNYRLPWFSEWLYAAWEGRRCPHSFSGSDELGNVGWYKENSRGQLPVGQRLDANDFELYDMSGGVWEYVQWEKKFSRDSYGKYVAIGCSFISPRQECHWTDSSVTLVDISRDEEDRKKGRSIGFRLVRE
ncbi:MAG: SUMF1/EgtB/PvdO family nonheme iron enzyme, partial [Bacteroidota bacterium]